MGWWNKDDDKTNWPDVIHQQRVAAKREAQELAKLYADMIKAQKVLDVTMTSIPTHQGTATLGNINQQQTGCLGAYPLGLGGLAQGGYPQGILGQAVNMPQGYINWPPTVQSAPAAPKPVPMDPPFSLDELEAAQTFIEALETA